MLTLCAFILLSFLAHDNTDTEPDAWTSLEYQSVYSDILFMPKMTNNIYM